MTISKSWEDMSLTELEQERAYWEAQMASTTSWGAGYGAADGFRRSCIAWIARRKLEEIPR